MFSLIISIIAIALVAALALASIYYGGSAFQEGSTDAEASTIINQGQQIQGAVTLADVDEKWSSEAAFDGIGDLVTNKFLKEVPSVRAKSWTLTNGDTEALLLLKDGSNYDLVEVCKAIEEEAGRDDTLEATAQGGQFGCYTDPTDGSTAYYKI